MSKYIIELDDRIKLVTSVGVTENGVVYTTSDYVHNLEELNSDYINEHYGSLQDEAYKRGINDGSLDVKQRVEGAYHQGLNDAWEAARKIVDMWDRIDNDELLAIFGITERIGYSTIITLFGKQTASEAIEKLKAYEEKQNDKIEVGDEVEPFYTDITGVVTLIDGDTIYILWRDGSSTSAMKLKEVTKTGRHFNIDSFLKEMKDES